MARTLVLKLGGSLVTDKSKAYCLRERVLKTACAEVRECRDAGLFDRLLVVHGVGSFGHPPVIEHKLYKGFIDKGQLMPISRTQSKVNELRAKISACLQDEGLPVNYLHISSIATATKGKITRLDVEAARGWLEIGMVPVLGGDMVQDTAMGFSVGSGDQVAALLAKEFKASHLVFATDVAGVYETDPKSTPDARILSEVSLSAMGAVDLSHGKGDASGAMRGKLASVAMLEPELRQGMEMAIMSMMHPGNLRAFLEGKQVQATRIRA
jgi:isopentenyl phosphate kinase